MSNVWGERIGAYRVWLRKHKGKRTLENLCVDGKITLKRIFKKRDEGMDWIHLAQDRD
jgi:hypothetical protein